MHALLGIDLGTTYCAVATLDDHGRPVTLPNRDGDILTPSAIFLSGKTAVVGQAALDIIREQPDSVAVLVKRRMGYADFGRPVGGMTFRPETLAAVILKKLLLDATDRVGPIRRAVITVPAYFDDTRRRATRDAGRIAGLEEVDIVEEPCAAALSSRDSAAPDGLHDETVLVYDLGGGTFDVSIVRIAKKRFQTLAIEGDVHLGGHDWDTRIVDYLVAMFRSEIGADPREDPRSNAQLFAAAERAKRTLSKLPQTSITVSHAGKTLTATLTRDKFEEISRDLLTRTRLTAQQALKRAGLSWEQVDRVLLVGGSTHMPMTRRMIRDLTGKEPPTNLAVSEMVARGAAIHAGLLAARHKPKRDDYEDVVEVAVAAHALGVEVRHKGERINDMLIAKNTQLPTSGERVYHTVRANQRRVRVKVLQGDARQAEACIPVGECWIDELPSGLPANSPVKVVCTCGEDGLVTVAARDPSGRVVRAELRREGGLSEADVRREKAWLDSVEVT